MSSVMVPMTTRVFSGRARVARRERDRGGRLTRDMNRRRRTTRLKGEVVRPVIIGSLDLGFGWLGEGHSSRGKRTS